MKKEEIQDEAELYNENQPLFNPAKGYHSNLISSFTKGVLSDTARKHWEPKWINSAEILPTEKDANEFSEVLATSKYGSPKVVIYLAVEKHKDCYIKWMPIPTFND